jgi:hypothetical protein
MFSYAFIYTDSRLKETLMDPPRWTYMNPTYN